MYEFTKAQRLLQKKEYDAVFAQAKKILTNDFVFLFKDNELAHARLGLALSKKMIAKAHDRNRIKRQLRETFRIRQLPAVDIVVLARKGIAKISPDQLFAKLEHTWDKLLALYAR